MSALPENISAGLWRASELGVSDTPVCSSGHRELDAELPGGGWPNGNLIEILQAQAGHHEWRFLMPSLRVQALSGKLVLIGCPHMPFAPALWSNGILPSQVLSIETDKPAHRLWAAEQSLRCRDVSALMVWLPKAKPDQLRRLQMAAQSAVTDSGAGLLVFAFRPAAAREESSPAPLRMSLRLANAEKGARVSDLEIDIFKRRGPSRDEALIVTAALPAAAALRSSAKSSLPKKSRPIEKVQPIAPVFLPDIRHAVDRPSSPVAVPKLASA